MWKLQYSASLFHIILLRCAGKEPPAGLINNNLDEGGATCSLRKFSVTDGRLNTKYCGEKDQYGIQVNSHLLKQDSIKKIKGYFCATLKFSVKLYDYMY